MKMFDITMLLLAICVLLITIAGIVGLFIAVCKDTRKLYKVTYVHIFSMGEFVAYVRATSKVHVSRKFKNKNYAIRSIEELKDE